MREQDGIAQAKAATAERAQFRTEASLRSRSERVSAVLTRLLTTATRACTPNYTTTFCQQQWYHNA